LVKAVAWRVDADEALTLAANQRFNVAGKITGVEMEGSGTLADAYLITVVIDDVKR
jgi:hypothetical protein